MESNGEKGKKAECKSGISYYHHHYHQAAQKSTKNKNFNRDEDSAYVCVFVLWGCSGSKSTEMLKCINPI